MAAERRDTATTAAAVDPFSLDVNSMLGAGAGLSGATLQNPYLMNGPELLFQDELIGGVRKRSWSEKMFYGVGTTYLIGLNAGGLWGLYEGLRHPDATTTRLRFNSVLNAMTRRGPFLGNSLGVIALMYHCIDSSIVAARGTDDVVNSVVSGVLAGALFKSTAGVRAAGLAGLLGGAYIAGYTALSEVLGV